MKLKKIITRILLILLLALVAFTFVYLILKGLEPAEQVEFTSPVTMNIEQMIRASGSIDAVQTNTVKSQLTGILDELFIHKGDVIQRGAALAKIKIVPDPQSLLRAETDLEKARIAFQAIQKDYNNARTLFDGGVISENEFLQAEKNYKLGQQDLQLAQNNYTYLKEGTAEGHSNVSNFIVSTISGTVLDIYVESGDAIMDNQMGNGTEIALIADLTNMIFKGTIDETEIGKVQKGMEVRVYISAFPDQVFDGVLSFISPMGKNVQGSIQFDIEVTVDFPENLELRSGYSSSVEIILASAKDVLALEEKNIYWEDGKAFVYVVEDDLSYHLEEVELGLSDGIWTEIKSGITAGQKVKKLY